MRTQNTGGSRVASFKSAGLAYKVGLGVVVAGLVFAASSLLFGGITFSAISALLGLLGAPEDREFLPLNEPEAGGDLLQFFGIIILACGICIVGIRFLVELLGLADAPEFTARLGWGDKLGASIAMIGLLIVVPSGITQILLYQIFLYKYGPGTAMYGLAIAMYAGGVILLIGLAILILKRPGPRKVLLGWTDRLGWGKIGCGWINKLGLGLIALALAGGILGFEDPAIIVAVAGVCILIVGFVPHILGGRRP